MARATYKQHVKDQVWRKILKHAVTMLTIDRVNAPVVRGDDFLETLDYAVRFLKKFGIITQKKAIFSKLWK